MTQDQRKDKMPIDNKDLNKDRSGLDKNRTGQAGVQDKFRDKTSQTGHGGQGAAGSSSTTTGRK